MTSFYSIVFWLSLYFKTTENFVNFVTNFFESLDVQISYGYDDFKIIK